MAPTEPTERETMPTPEPGQPADDYHRKLDDIIGKPTSHVEIPRAYPFIVAAEELLIDTLRAGIDAGVIDETQAASLKRLATGD